MNLAQAPERVAWAVLIGLLAALIAGPAAAQLPGFDTRCLPGNDLGNGLDLAIDGQGDVHLTRVDRIAGDLLYTRIGPDGAPAVEVVESRIGLLLATDVEDTGVAVEGDTVYVCYIDRRRRRARLATLSAGQWTRETIEDGLDGDGCSVVRDGDRVRMAYQADGVLRVASRVDGGAWQVATADEAPGQVVGGRPAIAVGPAGEVVVAHRDSTERALRVVRMSGEGAWVSVPVDSIWLDGGWEPSVVFTAAGRAVVHHGQAGDQLGSQSDLGLLETAVTLPDEAETVRFPDFAVGGSVNNARSGRGTFIVTREFSRSALFGNDDALVLFDQDPPNANDLERYGSANSRHVFRYTRVAVDPFGLPVVAYLDERSPSFNDPGGAEVCVKRPVDTDLDRVPDLVEVDLGLDPAVADTDGDGRSDGEELLIDGTDPGGEGGCVPAAETCNGEDDDCDGDVDEALSRRCYGGPEGTADVGECRSGSQQCVAGAWGACEGTATPRFELCSGLDEDCDGSIDEGNPEGGAFCRVGGVGACDAGETRCVDTALVCDAVGEPSDEVCNLDDDDCDGRVDELTVTCGVGACAVEVAACDDQGQPAACQPGAPALDDSTCDGIDDDCDGTTDEDCCPDGCCDGGCADNLVPDGAMEAVDPWPQDSAPACVKSAAAAYSGQLGMLCGPGGGSGRQVAISLDPGAFYTFQVRHRVAGGTLYAFLGYRQDGQFISIDGTAMTVNGPADDWSTHLRVFRTPGDLDRGLRVVLLATGEAMIDDISITPLAEGSSLIANGTVEDLTGSWNRYSATACTSAGGDAYNGSGALACVGAAGARVPKLPLDRGGLYRFRFAYRVDDAPLYGWFGLRRADGVFEEIRGAALRAYVPTDGWRLFERVVRAIDREGVDYEVVYYANGLGLVDDVDLIALPADASLIADGEFENPQIAGWSRYGARACTVTADAWDGQGAARCQGGEAGLRHPHIQALPDTLYRLDAAYVVDDGSLSMQIGVQSDGFDLFAGTSLTAFADPGTWKRHAATLRVPAQPAGDVRLVMVAGGDARVDGVRLTPLAEGDNLIADGDVELGGAGWRRYGGVACTIEAGGAFDGQRRIACADGQGLQTSAPVRAGERYRLDGQLDVSSGGIWVFVGVRESGVFTPVPGGSRYVTATGGYSPYQLEFDGVDPGAGDFRVILVSAGEASVDALSLVQID